MFYLYLKTHNDTGLKYLGYTTQEPFVYQGSGKHWSRHIKKHGYDVTTVILYETPFIEEIKEQGLYFSDLWNIVESKEFANLMTENGTGGGGFSKETIQKISKANKNRKCAPFTDNHRKKISESIKGENHYFFGKTHSVEYKIKMSESTKGTKNGMYGKNHSDNTKMKISNSKKGKTLSDEHKIKIGESGKGKLQPKTTCPHCGKTGGVNNMSRWHFDNCKIIFTHDDE